MEELLPSADELRDDLDGELRRFLRTKTEALPESRPLTAEIQRLIDAGGKRLRPSFCYWAYRAAGGAHGEDIVKASAALELLHTFAIVHDDIMDGSDERRGEPTSHALHGLGVALLVGDLALVLADAALMESGFGPDPLFHALNAYSRMRQQVIAGQYLDLEASTRPTVTEDEARKIAILKSGRYSVEEPLAIGAALAGAPEELGAALRSFGIPLGEAFQLRDDLLGMFGERENLGKPVDSDIREGKRHVLFAKAAALLEGSDRDFLIEHWGRGAELSEEDVAHLRRLVSASGARRATEDLLESLSARARDALGAIPAPDGARAALADLARRATHRLD